MPGQMQHRIFFLNKLDKAKEWVVRMLRAGNVVYAARHSQSVNVIGGQNLSEEDARGFLKGMDSEPVLISSTDDFDHMFPVTKASVVEYRGAVYREEGKWKGRNV